MHTYNELKGKGIWQVVFLHPNSSSYNRTIYNTTSEIAAMDLTAYLNGGQRPDWLELAPVDVQACRLI